MLLLLKRTLRSIFLLSGILAFAGCSMLFHSSSEDELGEFFLPYPVPEKNLYQNPKGQTLHYRVHHGKAASVVLVFVHGSPGNWENFAHFFKEPTFRDHYDVIVVDRPGYGESDFGKSMPALNDQAGLILEALKEELKLDSKICVLIGHSLGGPVVTQMAINAPDIVDGLVLVAASMDPKLEDIRWIQHPASWIPFRWFVPDAWRVSNEEIFPHETELQLLAESLSTISIPVWVIQGEQDNLVPSGNADYIECHFSSADIKMMRYDELNHFIPFSQPDIVVEAVHGIIKSIEK